MLARYMCVGDKNAENAQAQTTSHILARPPRPGLLATTRGLGLSRRSSLLPLITSMLGNLRKCAHLVALQRVGAKCPRRHTVGTHTRRMQRSDTTRKTHTRTLHRCLPLLRRTRPK